MATGPRCVRRAPFPTFRCELKPTRAWNMLSSLYCWKASEPSCSAASAANACGPPPMMTTVADSSCRPASSMTDTTGSSHEQYVVHPLGLRASFDGVGSIGRGADRCAGSRVRRRLMDDAGRMTLRAPRACTMKASS